MRNGEVELRKLARCQTTTKIKRATLASPEFTIHGLHYRPTINFYMLRLGITVSINLRISRSSYKAIWSRRIIFPPKRPARECSTEQQSTSNGRIYVEISLLQPGSSQAMFLDNISLVKPNRAKPTVLQVFYIIALSNR